MTREVSRRVLLSAVPGVLLAGCSGSPEPLRLAAGEDGGFYAEFGRLLAAALTDAGQPASPVGTGGSVDNVARVQAGPEQVGLALADVAETPAAAGLRALGRVYENYLQLVVRADEPAADLAGLAGRRVSTGAPGSGAALTSTRLLDLAGVGVERVTLPLRQAVAALAARDVDAVLFSGGVPTPALAQSTLPVRLLPLDGLVGGLRDRWGEVYRAVRVPAGAYGATGARTGTVGVSNLLLARGDLAEDVVARVVEVLVERAGDLVPSTALGTQYLDQASLVAVGSVPLHPAAAATYRRLHG